MGRLRPPSNSRTGHTTQTSRLPPGSILITSKYVNLCATKKCILGVVLQNLMVYTNQPILVTYHHCKALREGPICCHAYALGKENYHQVSIKFSIFLTQA